jgi:glyoxylase-like metal-dependent hydrolase (beta-lactamase superfamily II)
MKQIDRRTFVQRTSVAGLSLLALSLGSHRAAADPDPPAGSAGAAPGPEAALEPDIFAFRVGGLDTYIIQDGTFRFPGVQPNIAPEASKAELDAAFARNFLPADHLALSLNVVVLKTASGIVLFDGGAGGGFGPVAGKLSAGLARLHIAPKDVKAVCVTHGHMDHIAGLLDAGGRPLFPNARIIAWKTEVDFWTSAAPNLSGMRTPPETRSQMAASIKSVFEALKSSIELKEPGKVTPEIELIAAPGHTPGHSVFRVTHGGESLLVIGDAVHSYALQFPHPEWTFAFDVDSAMAVKTRRKLFQDLAADRMLAFGYHLPFPGIGHVRTAGAGFEWVPRPWVV